MSHADDSVAIDAVLHTDLKKAAGAHPAATIATSPLAKALAADNGPAGDITNSTLTAYATAIEAGPVHGLTEPARQALVARLTQAFPRR
jgi:hypothetical protein